MSITVLGTFDHIDKAAKTAKPLESAGFGHHDLEILTNAPYPEGVVFHKDNDKPMWKVVMTGGFIGFWAAVGLAGGTQWIMNLTVSGKPTFSIPPLAVICYEFTLLGAVLGTFLSMIWWMNLPDWNELAYDPDICNGRVSVLVRCPDEVSADKAESIMKTSGALRTKRGRDDF